jgi:uncharacterized protein YndB with AHSA1/START domain
MSEQGNDGPRGSATGTGTVEDDGDRRTVRFVRDLDAPVDDVWDALTDPARLGRWLAPTTIDPRAGGEVHHDFGEGETCHGRILTWDPPRVLEYGWAFTGEPDSVVRFELTPTGTGTRLTLVHRQLGAPHATGYGAGWHAHLDRLAAELAGDVDAIDWAERFAAVLPRYRVG